MSVMRWSVCSTVSSLHYMLCPSILLNKKALLLDMLLTLGEVTTMSTQWELYFDLYVSYSYSLELLELHEYAWPGKCATGVKCGPL